MFNQDEDRLRVSQYNTCTTKLIRADGVIIATPEHNH